MWQLESVRGEAASDTCALWNPYLHVNDEMEDTIFQAPLERKEGEEDERLCQDVVKQEID